MAIRDITTGLQSVSTAGAVTGSLDTSALSGQYTIKIRVAELTAAKSALLALEDTNNATPFSDAIVQWAVQLTGAVTQAADKVFSIHSRDLPLAKFGASNTKFRINALAVTATPGLKVHAWLEP